MNDIAAAILLAQAFVEGGGVDQRFAARLAGVGNLQQPIRIEARHDERCALIGQCIHGRNRIVALADNFSSSV